MSAGTKRPKFQEELFDLQGYRPEEFPHRKMGDEKLPIKKEEDHVTWSLGGGARVPSTTAQERRATCNQKGGAKYQRLNWFQGKS
ncbi:uncharacterized protein LOC144213425 isoform X3 [Stigmatopora nigra]